jgi:hypothetical protein
VAVARNPCSSFIAGHLASTVTWAGKHSVELAADHLFDELARPSAHLDLDRIKPVVEKINSISAADCEESGFVVVLVMAWSPVRCFNAG